MALKARGSTQVERVRRGGLDASMVEFFNVQTDRATIWSADLPEGVTVDEELDHCRRDFIHFLRYWRFEDRETGVIRSFAKLWDGQQLAAEAMMESPWLYLLKAGKLGFTELECAYDGWVLRFAQSNARVHVFSMNDTEAKELARIVRFGMDHLPDWMSIPIAREVAGGDTERQMRWIAGRDDVRTLRAYASTKNASIANSCTHAHLDELARMPWPEDTYSAAISTVPQHGTMHIVTRGAGEGSYSHDLWDGAHEEGSPLRPIFMAYWMRPRHPVGTVPDGSTDEDLQRQWYEEQVLLFPSIQQLHMYAPRTAEEALSPNVEESFVPIEWWDSCYDASLPELNPGDPIPAVMSLDAGITNDYFAITILTRDPREGESHKAALRRWRVFKPAETEGVVDFKQVEDWIRLVCLGGCVEGHPNKAGGVMSDGGEDGEPCNACTSGTRMPPFNIRHLTYDPYQLHDMQQRLSREGVTWLKAFDQGSERLQADTDLRQLIMRREFTHSDDPALKSDMRQAVMNAKIKVPKGEDSRARMEKRNPKSKIDLAVSLSMGVKRILWLRVG